jgi:predicted DNA-binding transcriptional regulator AlpA
LEIAALTGGDVLLRAPDVAAVIGVSLATLYRMIAASEYPRPIAPTAGTRAWCMSVVQAWIRERVAGGCDVS